MFLQTLTVAIGLLIAGHAVSAQPVRVAAPERSDVYQGPVEVSVADDFEQGVSTTIYRFRQDGREITTYQNSADATLVRCGDIVRIDGVRLGDTMKVRQARIAQRAAAGAGCSAVGPQRVAIILATFPGVPAPPTTAAALRRLLFDEVSFSANSWYRQVSYGKLSLSGEVFGPFTLDRSYSCKETAQMRAAAVRAADRDINFNEFERYILIYPPIRDCGFGGMGTLGCSDLQTNDGSVRASWIWSNYPADPTSLLNLLVHEFGHNLGLGHSRTLRFPGAALEADDYHAVPVEYGDRSALMGSGRFGDFAAAHKLEMGWLQPETDVVTVEGDGEFVLSPLGNSSGVRGIRVRRRSGADEWLWLEYRQSGDGVLVRRETSASGTLTHLLDMTPAPLEESRFDLGVSSEARPELQPGSRWTDPHSDLTISVRDAGEDGIPVVVRYTDRCAVPDRRQVTVTVEPQVFALPVAIGPDCQWQVTSGRSWLRASRGDTDASIQVNGITNKRNRSGVVTVGRHTVQVIQKGPPEDLQILSVSPPGAELPVNASVPFVLYLRDENGPEDTQAIQLSVIPREGSAAAPCYFRFSGERRVVEISDDGVDYRDDESSTIGRSGSCALEAATFRVDPTDLLFRFSLVFTIY